MITVTQKSHNLSDNAILKKGKWSKILDQTKTVFFDVTWFCVQVGQKKIKLNIIGRCKAKTFASYSRVQRKSSVKWSLIFALWMDFSLLWYCCGWGQVERGVCVVVGADTVDLLPGIHLNWCPARSTMVCSKWIFNGKMMCFWTLANLWIRLNEMKSIWMKVFFRIIFNWYLYLYTRVNLGK